MKKIICVLALSIIVCACNKTSDTKPVVNQTNTQNLGAQKTSAGIMADVHISALNYCYDKLSELPANSFKNDENGYNTVLSLCAQYLATDANINMTSQQILTFYNSNGLDYASSADWISNQDNEIPLLIGQCAQDIQPLLQRLFDAVDNADDYAMLKGETESILADAQALSTNELEQMEHFVSIALSSYTYWITDNNVAKWNALFQAIGVHKMERHVSAILKGDIEGGVWGAISGAAAGGIGALPGAMIGAPVGSAIAGLLSLF